MLTVNVGAVAGTDTVNDPFCAVLEAMPKSSEALSGWPPLVATSDPFMVTLAGSAGAGIGPAGAPLHASKRRAAPTIKRFIQIPRQRLSKRRSITQVPEGAQSRHAATPRFVGALTECFA